AGVVVGGEDGGAVARVEGDLGVDVQAAPDAGGVERLQRQVRRVGQLDGEPVDVRAGLDVAVDEDTVAIRPVGLSGGVVRLHLVEDVDLAGRAAAVEADGVAVVALLGARLDAVAARRRAHARRAHARPAALQLAARVAAVAGRGVAVVALLG